MYNRNLRKPSPNKNIFKFASKKNHHIILCESALEFDACFHLEFSPSIVTFESQPTGIEYQMNNKVHRYTPDFKVVKVSGEIEYIEVKPAKIINSIEFREEFILKRNAYNNLGYKLLLISEKQIRHSVLLANLKILHRYTGSMLTDIHDSALKYIKSNNMVSISQLSLNLGLATGDCIAACAFLISNGLVKADLETEPLSKYSTLIEV